MRRPHFSEAAKSDLHEILLYLRKQDAKAAAGRLIGQLRARCYSLARRPGQGHRRDNLALGLILCPVGSYNIYFYQTAMGIEVVAIIHGAQDQADALSRR